MPCCKGKILVANNSGSRQMIAGSVANNVGLSFRQLHLIPVKKCADCRFAGFRLQVVTPRGLPSFFMQLNCNTLSSIRQDVATARLCFLASAAINGE